MSWRTKTRFRATFRILARAHKNNCWKHPDKKDYFFGVRDDNRLQFTVGRDIRLDPPQQGAIRSTTLSILTRSWTKSRSRWSPQD